MNLDDKKKKETKRKNIKLKNVWIKGMRVESEKKIWEWLIDVM